MRTIHLCTTSPTFLRAFGNELFVKLNQTTAQQFAPQFQDQAVLREAVLGWAGDSIRPADFVLHIIDVREKVFDLKRFL